MKWLIEPLPQKHDFWRFYICVILSGKMASVSQRTKFCTIFLIEVEKGSQVRGGRGGTWIIGITEDRTSLFVCLPCLSLWTFLKIGWPLINDYDIINHYDMIYIMLGLLGIYVCVMRNPQKVETPLRNYTKLRTPCEFFEVIAGAGGGATPTPYRSPNFQSGFCW